MTNLLLPQAFFSLEGFAHAALFKDCTFVWEALERLSSYLRGQTLGAIEAEIPQAAHLIHPEQIAIGRGSVVEPGAFIQGPCIIGKDCIIRHGAYIRGHVVAGDGCVIGHDTEVKHAILLNRVHAAHFNYIGDSILGNGVNLGAGVKCANVRLDRGTVTVSVGKKKWNTGLKKLGAIVGDGAQVGCNAVTNPGTVLGKNSLCYPCLNVQGFIPENAQVKPGFKNIVESL